MRAGVSRRLSSPRSAPSAESSAPAARSAAARSTRPEGEGSSSSTRRGWIWVMAAWRPAAPVPYPGVVSGSPRLVCLHHLAQPFLGLAERPLRAAGLELDERRLAEGDPLPALAEADGILTLGGSESVLDVAGDPTLSAEAALLREAAAAGLPALRA